MSDRDALLALAERCEQATGADRELDLAIYLALNPDGEAARRIATGVRGLTGDPGQRWELSRGALLYEQRDQRGTCWASGGIPITLYTASLDAAMTLVPEGSRFIVDSDGCHCRITKHDNPFAPWNGWAGLAATMPLAVTTAALRARAANA